MGTNKGIWSPHPNRPLIYDSDLEDENAYTIPWVITRKEVISILLELMRQRIAQGAVVPAIFVNNLLTRDTTVVIHDDIHDDDSIARAFEARIEQLVTERTLSTDEFYRFNHHLAFSRAKDDPIESVAINLSEFV